MRQLLKNKGFTLIELLAVLIVLGVLITTVSIGVSNSMHSGRISSTTNSLQLFAADIETATSEYGYFTPEQEIGDKRLQVLEFLTLLEQYYLHTYFNRETLQVFDTFFEIKTSTLLDGWDMPFIFRYYFEASKAGTCLFVSSGADRVFSDTYHTGEFGDDMILVVSPKRN